MPDYSKYKWSVNGAEVKHGGKVTGVVLNTSLLDAMTAEVEEIMSDIILDIGDETAMETARLAPVDTGRLSDSYLEESKMVGKLLYRVQDGVPYGIFQELGTSKMAAQPHLVPAFEEVEEKLETAIKELFK